MRAWRHCLTSLARPTRAPELAARYTTGRRSASACSVAARNAASSRGPNDPLLYVMSLAIAMTCKHEWHLADDLYQLHQKGRSTNLWVDNYCPRALAVLRVYFKS